MTRIYRINYPQVPALHERVVQPFPTKPTNIEIVRVHETIVGVGCRDNLGPRRLYWGAPAPSYYNKISRWNTHLLQAFLTALVKTGAIDKDMYEEGMRVTEVDWNEYNNSSHIYFVLKQVEETDIPLSSEQQALYDHHKKVHDNWQSRW